MTDKRRSNTSGTGPAAASPRRPRRRLLPRIAIILLVLIAAVAFGGPVVIGRVAKGRIEDALAKSVKGTATLGRASFSWPGRVRLEDLRVAAGDGSFALAVRNLEAEVAPLEALSGRYVIRATVDGSDVTLRELAPHPPAPQAPRAAGPAPADSPAPRPARGAGSPLPELDLDLRLTQGRVVILGHDGTRTAFDDVAGSFRMSSPDDPLVVELRLGRTGGGSATLAGRVTITENRRIAADRIRGGIDIAVTNLSLAELAPLARSYGGLSELAGNITGKSRIDLTSPTAFTGNGDFRVTGLRVAGGPVGLDAIDLPEVTLRHEGAVGTAGGPRQKILLAAPGIFDASVDADMAGLSGDGGSVDADLRVKADLAKLARALPGFIRLRPGSAIAGDLTGESKLTLSAGGDRRAADLTLRVTGFRATDAGGRPVDLGPELTARLRGSMTGSGSTSIEACDVRVGSVTLAAAGSVDLDNRTLGDSTLKLDADLDDLSRKLSSFLDLGGTIGGKIRVDSRASAAGPDVASSRSEVVISGFRLQGFGTDIGPLDMTIEQVARLGLARGGKTEIERLEVRSDVLELTATGEIFDIFDPAALRGTLTLAARSSPDKVAARLAGLFRSFRVTGPDFSADGTVTFGPGRTAVRAEAAASSLLLHGTAFGPEGAALSNLRLKADATLAGDRVDLPVVELTAASVRMAPEGSVNPVTVRDLSFRISGRRDARDLIIETLALGSSLATGTGALTARNFGEPGMTLNGQIDLSGAAESLVAVAGAFVPELRPARAAGTFRIRASAETAGESIELRPEIRFTALELDGCRFGDRPVAIRRADVSLASDLLVETSGSGRATARSLALSAPGAELSGSGSATGFLGAGNALGARLETRFRIDPEVLDERLSALLLGYGLAGTAASGDLTISMDAAGTGITGRINAPSLTIRFPVAAASPPVPPRVLSQERLVADFDVLLPGADGESRLTIRRCRITSGTGTVTASGRMGRPGRSTTDLTGNVETALERVVADLGAILGLADWQLAGQTRADLSLRGAEPLAMAADLRIENLRGSLPGRQPGERVPFDDRLLTLAFRGTLAEATGSSVIEKFAVDSTILRGNASGTVRNLRTEPVFEGVRGEFTYIPDRLGALLAPFLPGRLSGSTEEKTRFTLEGRARDVTVLSILRGVTADGSAGLGRIVFDGIDAAGTLNLTCRDQRARTDSTLKLNGGTFRIQGDLDLREEPGARSTLTAGLQKAAVTRGMAPLLALLNPIFALGEAGSGGVMQGLIDADLSLTWSAPIDENTFAGDPAPTSWKPLDGRGRIAVTELVTTGANLLGQLFKFLDTRSGERVQIDPVEFTIRSGRLFYDRAIPMKIGGQETRWTGSIGLDRTLDLVWQVPVTADLAGRLAPLRPLEGTVLEIPITGSADNPVFRPEEILTGLLRKGVENTLQKKVGGLLPGLLGGKKEGGEAKPPAEGARPPEPAKRDKLPVPIPPAPKDPPRRPPAQSAPAPKEPPRRAAEPESRRSPLQGIRGAVAEKRARDLLSAADRLWDQGRKAEARTRYGQVRNTLSETKVFAENRERIESRLKE